MSQKTPSSHITKSIPKKQSQKFCVEDTTSARLDNFPRLLDLPPELVAIVFEYVSLKDLKQFRLAHRNFEPFLIRNLFFTIPVCPPHLTKENFAFSLQSFRPLKDIRHIISIEDDDKFLDHLLDTLDSLPRNSLDSICCSNPSEEQLRRLGQAPYRILSQNLEVYRPAPVADSTALFPRLKALRLTFRSPGPATPFADVCRSWGALIGQCRSLEHLQIRFYGLWEDNKTLKHALGQLLECATGKGHMSLKTIKLAAWGPLFCQDLCEDVFSGQMFQCIDSEMREEFAYMAPWDHGSERHPLRLIYCQPEHPAVSHALGSTHSTTPRSRFRCMRSYTDRWWKRDESPTRPPSPAL